MNCLLDTCALIEVLNSDNRFSGKFLATLAKPETLIFFNAISVAELAIKLGKGKLSTSSLILGRSGE